MTLRSTPDAARRMRWLAGGLLVVCAVLFAVARAQGGEGWAYVRAFAEAALVGGLADWFAVTALFRRPLGLPIPHTAIIPANKDRIAEALAGFLRGNFLTAPVVARRMQSVDVAGRLGAFLADPQEAGGGLSKAAAGLAGDILHSLPGDYLGRLLTGALHGQLEKLDVAPLLGQALRAAMADGRHKPLIEAMLRRAGEMLEANEDLLRAMVQDRAGSVLRWTGLDGTLANAILDGLYRLLAECVVDPEHPLRARLEHMLEKLAEDLCHDPETQAKVARAKAGLLANPAMAAWLDGLWDRLRRAMVEGASNPQGLLEGRLGAGLAGLGQALRTDAQARAQLNRFARRAAVGIATRYGGGLVSLVSQTVRRWEAQTVSRRIEGLVGRDLQFIRLNGTLVGGLVGLALHAADRLF